MDTIFCIDIGSNSVRLAKVVNGKTEYKLTDTTKLSEGMTVNGFLSHNAMERTMNAIKNFAAVSKKEKAPLYIFCTEAFRRASNGREFAKKIQDEINVNIDILDGDEEAKSGYLGAGGLKENGLTVIDIGGGSTEIISGIKEDIKYCKSHKIGVVTLKDNCGQDRDKLQSFIDNALKTIDNLQSFKCIGIGGTATSLAAVDLELSIYDANKVQGHTISVKRLGQLTDKLLSMSIEEIKKLKGVQEKRADVMGGGALLMLNILKKLNADKLYISESDNIEGYLMYKGLLK